MVSGIGDWADDVRRVVRRHLPGVEIDSLVPLGEGTDNVVVEINAELVVRYEKDGDPSRVEREARLLAAVAGISPLPVPQPRFVDADLGCLVYTKLAGTPLLEMPAPYRSGHRLRIAELLGELLDALHAAPLDRIGELADTDLLPLGEWRDEAVETYATLTSRIPARFRRSVEGFLQAPPPAAPAALAFSHNDLGIEHVLVDPVDWTPIGIIDWTDAAIVDPAHDYGLLLRDLGPEALDAALRAHMRSADDVERLAERALFYARCSVLEDLAYGLETGRTRYAEKSLAALEWLYGRPSRH